MMLTAAAVAYLYENSQPRVYQAQVTLIAQPLITGPEANAMIEAIKKTMPSYAQQLGSKTFWQQVIDDNLIRDVDVDALSGQIQVQARPDQNAIVMQVDQAGGEQAALRAALLADRISNAFVERQAAEYQNANASGNRIVWIISQAAEPPTQPYKPRPRLYAFAAALFGLLLGLLLAVGLDLMDTTLKTPADVRQYTELNTLGIIPKTRGS